VPINGQIVLNGDGFLETAWGQLSAEDVISFLDGILASPPVPDPYFVLLDYSKVKDITGSITEVRAVVQRSEQLKKQTKRRCVLAVIATKPVVYGLSRMWQVLAEFKTGWYINVFRDRDEALAWLQHEVQLRHQVTLPPPAEWLPPEAEQASPLP
jgi:hypothetical protein